MKYFGREIEQLSDWELITAYGNCEREEAKRNEASKHDKFKKMSFPAVNPEFKILKTELFNEISKRKLEIKK